MSYTSRPTTRVTLTDPSYWVDLYTKLRYKESKDLAPLMNVAATAEKDENGRPKLGLEESYHQSDLILNTFIAEWNLDDDQGNILPVTPENVDLLDQQDVTKVVEAAVKVFELDQESDEKKGSSKA